MFEIYLLGTLIRGGMFVMENKARASYSSDFVRATVRCALQWPVDLYDSIVGEQSMLPWDDHNRFCCPKEGQPLLFPEERNYHNLFLYLEDIKKAEECNGN